MMYRIVSSLLMPLVLVSPSFCAAHSHVGTSVVEEHGHSARPHVHIDAGNHHDHHPHDEDSGHDSHEGSPTVRTEQGPIDHDSDALYLSDSQLFNGAKLAEVAEPEISEAHVVYDDSATIAGLRLCLERDLPPPLGGLKCPLYLLTLSIRC